MKKLILFSLLKFITLKTKKILQKHGIKFKSNTDTEVILQLYKHMGIPGLKMLRGCFL